MIFLREEDKNNMKKNTKSSEVKYSCIDCNTPIKPKKHKAPGMAENYIQCPICMRIYDINNLGIE